MNTEPLDHVMKKRNSFSHMWKLLAPKDEFKDLYTLCLKRWNDMTYREQQCMYWFINEKKERGEIIYDNPLFALTYTHPHPYNWNGKSGINDMLKSKKMVSACYKGSYGVYTLCESTIFEMIDVKPLNFKQ